MPKLWLGVVTLFPGMFSVLREYGISGRVLRSGLVSLQHWNPRDFTTDRRGAVDDRPFGGGPGMLMMVQPLRAAIKAARAAAPEGAEVLYLTPQGRRLDQSSVRRLARASGLVLVTGRYEGIDERVIENDVDQLWSIGDYVLSGGELPAMVLMDALIRLVPGALGDRESVDSESFADGLLEYPQYTRPRDVDGQMVPEILFSGDHRKIRSWRHKQALGRTACRRPDLLAAVELSDRELRLLREYLAERGMIP